MAKTFKIIDGSGEGVNVGGGGFIFEWVGEDIVFVDRYQDVLHAVVGGDREHAGQIRGHRRCA